MKEELDKSCKTPRWRMLKSQLNNLSAEEFEAISKESKKAVIIDVRTAESYASGRIPGSVNMDFWNEDFWNKSKSWINRQIILSIADLEGEAYVCAPGCAMEASTITRCII